MLKEYRTEINETFVDETEHINIAMSMYNLIEYSDNYADASGSLWQFKRHEIEGDVDLTVNGNHIPNNSSSFKYKSSSIADRNGVKIAVPLQYLSNFSRSLEMALINCKVELSLRWYENCILSSAGTAATFETTDTKLYVQVVTLKTEDNVKLSKLLSKGFKKSVYWNKYKVILKDYAANNYIRQRIYASFQGVNKLFVLAYAYGNNVTNENAYKNLFLPRLKIKNYNIEIDGRNFYDLPINELTKQYDKIRKISTGQSDDYTTGCLLDFAYFLKKNRLIAADLSK